MLQRILVPLDGSPFAESALAAGIALARKTNGSIRLLHVLDPASAFVVSEQSERERVQLEAYLDAVFDRVRSFWRGPVSIFIREGGVAQEIEAEVGDWGADVIAMSTHGRSGLSRLWMGSIADRVLRAAVCPVLMVRPREPETFDPASFDMSRVVIPVDGSEVSERAMKYGVILARAFEARAVVLRVVSQPGGFELLHSKEAIDALASARAQDRTEATDYVHERAADLRRAGVRARGVVCTEPGPAEAILDRTEGDWVVMSTHGRGGLDRAFFGSVADKVIRSSRHPVLVVPPARTTNAGDAEADAGSAVPTPLPAIGASGES